MNGRTKFCPVSVHGLFAPRADRNGYAFHETTPVMKIEVIE
jgi:hypothetical protein